MTEERITCIYHGNCADGFTAAWVVNKYFKTKGLEVLFIPGVYGTAPDYEKVETTTKLFIVDFSYDEEVMNKLNDMCDEIVVLDHHKSAEAIIAPMIKSTDNNISGVFDMEKSGALITWEYFFPTLKVPRFIEYISDRDLWKFELPYSKIISMYIFSYEYTFENWEIINSEFNAAGVNFELMANPNKLIGREHLKSEEELYLSCASFEYMVNAGKAIERKHLKDVKELCLATVQMKKFTKFGMIEYPVANLPYTLASDGCTFLANSFMDEFLPKVGLTYFQNKDGKYVFSLRSRDDTDVSEMAKKYNGGGHKNAAGFVVDNLKDVFG